MVYVCTIYPSLSLSLLKLDFTIKETLNFQDYSLSKSKYEDLFEQEQLDHAQVQKALYINNTVHLIAINNK
jgi:hypothetical protein